MASANASLSAVSQCINLNYIQALLPYSETSISIHLGTMGWGML